MSESLSRLLRAGPRQSWRGSRCRSRRFLLLLWGAAFTESTCQQVPPFCPCPGPSPEPRHLLSEAAFNFSFWTCQGKANLVEYNTCGHTGLHSEVTLVSCSAAVITKSSKTHLKTCVLQAKSPGLGEGPGNRGEPRHARAPGSPWLHVHVACATSHDHGILLDVRDLGVRRGSG